MSAQKLIVLTDGNLYIPNVENIQGLLNYLETSILTNPVTKNRITWSTFKNAYRVNIYSKYKKIEVIGHLQDDNIVYDINDQNAFYLIFSDRVKLKSVPENVAVICSSIRINQEDGKGGIYKICPYSHIDITLKRVYDALVVTKLLNKPHTKLRNFIENKIKTTGDQIYYDVGNYLLTNIGHCETFATREFLEKCFDKLLSMSSDKFNGLGATIFTRLNEVVRDKKMSTETMLSYKGFNCLNEVIKKFTEEQEKLNNGKISWNGIKSYLEKFIWGLLTVMIANELKFYITVDGNKILHYSNDSDIIFSNPDLILPHMENYVGYLITSHRGSFCNKPLTLFKELRNKNILDYVLKCKELKDMGNIDIRYVVNNDQYVKNQLRY